MIFIFQSCPQFHTSVKSKMIYAARALSLVINPGCSETLDHEELSGYVDPLEAGFWSWGFSSLPWAPRTGWSGAVFGKKHKLWHLSWWTFSGTVYPQSVCFQNDDLQRDGYIYVCIVKYALRIKYLAVYITIGAHKVLVPRGAWLLYTSRSHKQTSNTQYTTQGQACESGAV